jgi:S1-C subfamily serine protease
MKFALKNTLIDNLIKILGLVLIFTYFVFADAQTNEIEVSVFSYSSESIVKLIANGNFLGTGFIISSDGYILTCFHVIENLINSDKINKETTYQQVKIINIEDKYPFYYINGDKTLDIALLKLNSPEELNLKALPLGDSEQIQPFRTNFVANGYPDDANEPVPLKGYFQNFEKQINSWRVSAGLRRGSSGSPILSTSDNDLGMVVGIATYAVFQGTETSYSFVSPINSVKTFLRDNKIQYSTMKPQINQIQSKIIVKYPFTLIYDEHKPQVSEKNVCSIFTAVFGYKIVGYNNPIVPESSTEASNPTTIISNDGNEIKLCADLKSGPIYDQWRGWYIGNLVTEQVKR